MKHFVMLIFFVLTFMNSGFAQTEKLETGDSIRVAVERTKIRKELIQLHDSIRQTLAVFRKHIKKSTAANGMKYKTARKELLKYQNQLKLDLEEIKLTSQKGWTKDSGERILANTAATRKNYKRLSARF